MSGVCAVNLAPLVMKHPNDRKLLGLLRKLMRALTGRSIQLTIVPCGRCWATCRSWVLRMHAEDGM